MCVVLRHLCVKSVSELSCDPTSNPQSSMITYAKLVHNFSNFQDLNTDFPYKFGKRRSSIIHKAQSMANCELSWCYERDLPLYPTHTLLLYSLNHTDNYSSRNSQSVFITSACELLMSGHLTSERTSFHFIKSSWKQDTEIKPVLLMQDAYSIFPLYLRHVTAQRRS